MHSANSFFHRLARGRGNWSGFGCDPRFPHARHRHCVHAKVRCVSQNPCMPIKRYDCRKQRRSHYERAGVLIPQTPQLDGSEGCKLYDRAPHFADKMSVDDSSIYRTYQSRGGSFRGEQRARPVLTSVSVPEPPNCPHGHTELALAKGHVYESPHLSGATVVAMQHNPSPTKHSAST
jgi:hypothetical protein